MTPKGVTIRYGLLLYLVGTFLSLPMPHTHAHGLLSKKASSYKPHIAIGIDRATKYTLNITTPPTSHLRAIS